MTRATGNQKVATRTAAPWTHHPGLEGGRGAHLSVPRPLVLEPYSICLTHTAPKWMPCIPVSGYSTLTKQGACTQESERQRLSAWNVPPPDVHKGLSSPSRLFSSSKPFPDHPIKLRADLPSGLLNPPSLFYFFP